MISVYGVDFATQTDFFKLLGYARPLAKKLIAAQYGTLENVVKSRLKADTDDQAREMLLKLKGKNKAIDIEKECYKVAWRMLSKDQKSTIIATVASVLDMNFDDVKKNVTI